VSLIETIAGELGGILRALRGVFARKAVKRLVALFAALLVLSVLGTLIVAGSVKAPPQKNTSELWTPEKITDEMIFLPNEPDFLPEILFEQKPKEVWGEADIAPFWFNPREATDALWRKELQNSIDELLERIP
jgi:hypothetical protein